MMALLTILQSYIEQHLMFVRCDARVGENFSLLNILRCRPVPFKNKYLLILPLFDHIKRKFDSTIAPKFSFALITPISLNIIDDFCEGDCKGPKSLDHAGVSIPTSFVEPLKQKGVERVHH